MTLIMPTLYLIDELCNDDFSKSILINTKE